MVGVDVDNVLAATDPVVRQLISRFYGVQAEQSRISEWDYHLSLPISIDQERFIFSQVHSRYLQELQPLVGARDTLVDLSQRARIWVITGRPDSTSADTEKWLQAHRLPYDRLIFSPTKVELATELEVLIEDNWNTALQFADLGTSVLLVDYPWNRDRGNHHKITRVANWFEIQRELRAMWRPEGPEYMNRA